MRKSKGLISLFLTFGIGFSVYAQTPPTNTFTLSPTKFSTPTKTPLPKIVINEFVANPIENANEWIELYNPEIYNASLEHFIIRDSSSTKRLIGLEIPSNGFLVLEQGRDFNFYLNNSGDTITLKSATEEIDEVAYRILPEISDYAPVSIERGMSTGRYPNGIDTNNNQLDFKVFYFPSKGYSNDIIPATPTPTNTYTPTLPPLKTPTKTKTPTGKEGDFNKDGVIDSLDLLRFLELWHN